VRASDEDRERTLRQLRRHYAAGRLEPEELEQRIGVATRARTREELRALTVDLPKDVRARGRRAVSRVDHVMLRAHGAAFAGVNGSLVGIWALAGAGTFWPAWVLVPWGAGLGAHAYGSRALRRALGTSRRRRIGRGGYGT
jgi:uncharacterized protein DUF1707/2TM domain-containing protein